MKTFTTSDFLKRNSLCIILMITATLFSFSVSGQSTDPETRTSVGSVAGKASSAASATDVVINHEMIKKFQEANYNPNNPGFNDLLKMYYLSNMKDMFSAQNEEIRMKAKNNPNVSMSAKADSISNERIIME